MSGGTRGIDEARDAVIGAVLAADLERWQRRTRPVGIASLSTLTVVKTVLLRGFGRAKGPR